LYARFGCLDFLARVSFVHFLACVLLRTFYYLLYSLHYVMLYYALLHFVVRFFAFCRVLSRSVAFCRVLSRSVAFCRVPCMMSCMFCTPMTVFIYPTLTKGFPQFHAHQASQISTAPLSNSLRTPTPHLPQF
jgi:hypothetical protein